MAVDETGPFAVGVDFGTLSGRAVVVRVADGTELGSAVHEYGHGVLTDALPGGTRLGVDWALQVPSDYVDVLKNAVPAAIAAAGIDPGAVIGIGTDFTACTMVATLADGTPLCELAEFADRPHAYVKLWKHHAAQPQADRINQVAADRGETWLPRYGGLISSEWEFAKGLQLLEEDPELYARDGPLRRGGRLDRLAAHRYLRAQRLHGRVQGHPPGRRLSRSGVPGRAEPRLRRLRIVQIGPTDRPAGRRRRYPDRTGRRLDRAAGRHRGRGRQRRRPREFGRLQRAAPRPARRHHGHLDLPRGQRRRAARGARHVRRGRRRHRRRAVGVRGRAERRRRHLRALRGAPGAGPTTPRRRRPRASTCTNTLPGWPRASGPASTG